MTIAETIPAENQEQPDAIGHWTMADCLIHISSWDEEVRDMADIFLTSGEEQGFTNNVHDLNARFLEDKKSMDLEVTWNYFRHAHKTLIAFLSTLPEELFHPEAYIGNLVGTIVVRHYQGHRKDIETFGKTLYI